MGKTIRIGGASGYWGESAMATPQLLQDGNIDYLVYDYLAEITMSILARAKAKDPNKGYATDFVDSVIKPHAEAIAIQGIKVIANAGGVNPEACGAAIRAFLSEKNIPLKVAVITGDNILSNKDAIISQTPKDMFSGASAPSLDKIASINVYLGAFPVAEALTQGADIIITGRVVDSAVTLGACIHEFGWNDTDWDLLASGSLAGHILECGPQATGGNFTDWEAVGDIANIGYPIAEIQSDGSFVTTKPKGTGGIVSVGTVSEQMLYEIGDPQSYILPDVICDFTEVSLTHIGDDRVHVSRAKGSAAPRHYKTCLTYRDGFRGGTYLTFYGLDADKKARKVTESAYARAEATLRHFNLGPFTKFSLELIGAGSQMGENHSSSELVAKVAVKHPDMRGVGIFLKELAGIGLATPPGLSGFTGAGRPRPSPIVRLFSYLTPKADINITIDINGTKTEFKDAPSLDAEDIAVQTHPLPNPPNDSSVNVPLIALAWGRSGDKGDKANVGIIARKADYLPYIWAALTPDYIRLAYGHFLEDSAKIDRFILPSSNAMNILMDKALGGGGAASLRNDAQGKGFAQILLAKPIAVSKTIAETL